MEPSGGWQHGQHHHNHHNPRTRLLQVPDPSSSPTAATFTNSSRHPNPNPTSNPSSDANANPNPSLSLNVNVNVSSSSSASNNTSTTFVLTTPSPEGTLHPERPGAGNRVFSRLSVASKGSWRSSSFEADDERSEGDDDDQDGTQYGYDYDDYDNSFGSDTMSAGAAEGAVPPRYHGEDTRPTSPKELAGWYMYGFAAETYVICAIGSFIPILLESLARKKGVLLSDGVSPCGDSSDHDQGQCVIYLLGMEVNTASFAMYTFSISVLIQALLVVSISCAADHGNYRKKLLLLFAWVGSLSVMGYIFVSEHVYVLGAILAIISNTSFGASFVLLNSFLPLLVRNHPEVQFAEPATMTPDLGATNLESAQLESAQLEPPLRMETDLDPDESGMCESTDALLGTEAEVGGIPQSMPQLVRMPTHAEVTSMDLQLSSQISSKGMGTGYIAGLFVQCMAIFILLAMGSSIWSLRIVLFVVGAWWTIFTIPAAMWLRPRPGPPMPSELKNSTFFTYILYSWKSLFQTVKQARRLIDIIFFLAAWFLLSDAIATTSSTAILFAKTQLHMKPSALGMINVISTLAGVVGAFSWAAISQFFRLKASHTILACICLFEIIPLYGLMGYLPFIKAWGVLGLQQPWEMYPMAAVFGFVLGGLSSYCRSLYGELIPPGSEAAFYALYAITDKGSSVFGPAIVGAIIDASGEIRPAFFFLAAVVAVPLPLMWAVDVERGKREGEKLAEIIEGFKVRAREGEGGVGDGRVPNGVSGAAEGLLAVYDDTTDTAAANGMSR